MCLLVGSRWDPASICDPLDWFECCYKYKTIKKWLFYAFSALFPGCLHLLSSVSKFFPFGPFLSFFIGYESAPAERIESVRLTTTATSILASLTLCLILSCSTRLPFRGFSLTIRLCFRSGKLLGLVHHPLAAIKECWSGRVLCWGLCVRDWGWLIPWQ